MTKVIKVGGSLMTNIAALTNCLNAIKENNCKERMVIVPGGGIFADQVRKVQLQWHFDDQTAHYMALLAMQQMALLFNSINSTFKIAENVSAIQQAWHEHSIVIWSPSIRQLHTSSVTENWDVSSDSLAAWLASQLNAQELILVKSADIPISYDIQALQKQGILDKAFADFVKNAHYKITVINKHKINEVLAQ